MIKLIICDLDDTLMSEYDYVLSGYRAVSKHMENMTGLDSRRLFSELKDCYDRHKKDPFNDILSKHGLSDSLKEEMIRVYRYHEPVIPLYSDIDAFLIRMEQKNIVLTILTDGNTQRQNMKIDSLGIRHYFNTIVVAEPEHFKPDSWGYEQILADSDYKAEDILCIGDNPKKDFYYPLSRGYQCIKTNRFVNREIPSDHPSIREMMHMDEIVHYILQ